MRRCRLTLFSDREFAAQYVFMDNTTYEETRLKKDESWSKYLKEGAEVALLVWNGRVISVDSPSTVELEVADTDPGLKGNTAAGGTLLRCCSACYSKLVRLLPQRLIDTFTHLPAVLVGNLLFSFGKAARCCRPAL